MMSPQHKRLPPMNLQRWQVAIEFAVQSLWSARRRMWLVVLGVAIGFGAIFSMLIIGGSVQAEIQASLDSLGGDIVTLSINRSSLRDDDDVPMAEPAADETVTPDTLLQLLRVMPGVEGVAPVYERSYCAASSADVRGLQVIQTSVEIQSLLGLRWAQGRGLSPADAGHNNLVLGSAALENLRQQKPGIAVGSDIQSCGRTYRIVGVLQTYPGSDFVQALQINESALVAISGNPPHSNGRSTLSWLVRLRTGFDAQALSNQLVARSKQLLPGHSVDASGAWEFIQSRQQQISLYARFLAVLGSISLIVGVLGITNMMLVTVAERRAEIGLRMAIGAKPRDIVIQFLCEGVLICLAGAVLGMLLGWGVAVIALGLAGFHVTLSAVVILQASALAIVCGMVAGAYPAQKAANLDPVSSLQA